MKTNRLSLRGCLFLLVGLATTSLQADTFTVTSISNTGPGSLPVVISQANATPGNQTVEFAVSGTITLVAPLATITNSLTINGRNSVVISGGGTVPIFSFAPGTTNILSQLNLANGYSGSGGAAINNAGTLFVNGCAITGHNSLGGSGGAINNAGTLTILSSIISGNQAATGGAIYNSGSMTISESQVRNSQAGNGGGVCNVGTLIARQLTISSNHATLGYGGGIYNSGGLSISETTVSYNQATGQSGESPGRSGGGGGAGFGGGLYSSSGAALMTNSTFCANMATGGNGGSTAGVWDGNGGKGGGNNAGRGATALLPAGRGGYGGGGGGGNYSYNPTNIHSAADGGFGGGGGGAGYITNSVAGRGGFGGGNGGGANYPYGGGGGGGAGLGGGIFVENGTMVVVNCTMAANSATGGSGGAFADNPPPASGQGIAAGIFNYAGSIRLLNIIVAGNTAADNSPDLYGAFTSSGFNLIGNNQGATGLSINDYQNESANLGPLQDNGGLTFTCALLQGSLAIGGGTSVGAPTTDQRGIPRPAGHYDIGAVNFVTVPILAGQFKNSLAGFSLSTILDSTNSYRIQGSTNLTTWVDLTNYSSGGSHRLIDTVTNLNRRFYRAVMP